MTIRLLIAMLVVAAYGCRPADPRVEEPRPDDPPHHTLIAHTEADDAHTYSVDVDDSLAVFGRGRDLVIANVSDPARPAVLGSLTLPSDVRDVVIHDGRAYAAADSGGLQIVDLSNPAAPAVVGSMTFADRAYGVDVSRGMDVSDDVDVSDGMDVSNGLVYVAARSEGLRIVDVSDPSVPKEIGHIITPDEAVDIFVRGSYAYVAAWYESMRVIDIEDPSAPEEVSFASYDSYDNGAAWSVHVDGDIAVQAVPDMGLRTVDVSDPRNVKLYKVYRGLFAPVGAAVRGRTAFVADQDAGFRVLDLADPVQPVEIGTLALPGRAMSIKLSGDVAFVAAREAGLRIVDISRPNDPHEIGFVDAHDDVVDLTLAGDTLIAAGRQNGVMLRATSSLHEIAFHPGRSTRVATHGRRLFVGGVNRLALYESGTSDIDGELPNPTGKTVLADLPGTVRGLATDGEFILAAVGPFGLQILRAADLRSVGSYEPERTPSNKVQMNRTPLASWDILLEDDLAFAAFDDGIHIIDLSSAARPQRLSLLGTPERVYRLARQGSQLFAACDDGLRVFDVADPGHPTETGYLKTPSFATALAVDGDRLYVGSLNGLLTVVATAAPTLPIAEVDVADRILSLAVLPRGLAVAAGRQGIRIVADIVPTSAAR